MQYRLRDFAHHLTQRVLATNFVPAASLRLKLNQRGMTLIEIMIVLIIVGGLMAVLGNRVVGQLGTAQNKQAKIAMSGLGDALDMYRASCGSYPENLEALVEKPGDCPNWGPEPYLKKIPKDPWNGDFIYERSSRSKYVLRSLGADGAEGGTGSDADISSDEE